MAKNKKSSELIILELAESRGDLDLLYQFTKIVAESDSIGEGHGYCSKYEKKDFDEEVESLKNPKKQAMSLGYLEYAGVYIYEAHLKSISTDMVHE